MVLSYVIRSVLEKPSSRKLHPHVATNYKTTKNMAIGNWTYVPNSLEYNI